MIVVDTAVVAHLYFPSVRTVAAERLLEVETRWAAPPLWRSEFLHVATTQCRKGFIKWPDVAEVYELAAGFLTTFDVHTEYKKIIDVMKWSDCSACQAEFLALAKQLNTVLVTDDEQILKQFPKLSCTPEQYTSR